MKNLLLLFSLIGLMSACVAPQQLYSWEDYDSSSYNYLKDSNEKSIKDIKETYKKIIAKQTGTRGVVPPGIYADYGFLLLQENKNDEAKEMFLKEISLYPESKVFMERILKMIEL